MARNPQTTYWEIVKRTLQLFKMTPEEADATVRKERQRLQKVLSPDMQHVIYHDDPFKVAVRLDGGESPQDYVDHISEYLDIVQTFKKASKIKNSEPAQPSAIGIFSLPAKRDETQNKRDRRLLKPRNS
jgi:hypothetical protein